ncbi:MAG TPA: twin-arginine translocase TatA/TatE family subunit [Candidatus Eremiobacteraceae bacterium]|nr:twin-arginine translocase TatA/TatE family subunit [Candidatus Eremiobacteraceae bacterium]
MTPVLAVLDTPILLAIGAVIVLLFGAERLPKLARSMGLAKKEFDSAMRPADPSAAQPQSPPPPPPDDRPKTTGPPPTDPTA